MLTFETIERDEYGTRGSSYNAAEPQVVFITSKQEINELEGLVSQAALDQLAQLDFKEYFAIALFRGGKPSSGFDTIIERVARRGDQIVIYAQFWSTSPYHAETAAETSPYHLIKVRREGNVSQESEALLRSRDVTPTPPY